jgi:hypothetical protein
MMTRKDYVATAEILNDFYLDMPIGLEERFDEMVNGFAKMFAQDNERFLSTKFVDACYKEED